MSRSIVGDFISYVKSRTARTPEPVTNDPRFRPVDPRLGRIFRPDTRNARYPLKALLTPDMDLRDKSWTLNRSKFLDQQRTPECTGYSAAHDLSAAPRALGNITPDVAHAIYEWARRDDEWEGEDYDGSSVLGATRALKTLGFIGEYRWAGEDGSDIADDVALALSNIGGVVLGTDFLRGMFDLNDGVWNLTGTLAGGHAYFARWIAVSNRAKGQRLPAGATIRPEPLWGGPNSWGTGWGNRGEWQAWHSDMRRLLDGLYSPGEARISSQAFHR